MFAYFVGESTFSLQTDDVVSKATLLSLAPVAQLDRALACGAKGRAFESRRVYQTMRLTYVGLFVIVSRLTL